MNRNKSVLVAATVVAFLLARGCEATPPVSGQPPGTPNQIGGESPPPSPAPGAGEPGSAEGPAEFYQCSSDSDCVAVAQPRCCAHGNKDAVNRDRVADYQEFFRCRNSHLMCAQFMVNDTRAAICNTAAQRCEMVRPEDIHCGGFIRNAHRCPEGYRCTQAPNPDVAGQCVKGSRSPH